MRDAFLRKISESAENANDHPHHRLETKQRVMIAGIIELIFKSPFDMQWCLCGKEEGKVNAIGGESLTELTPVLED